MKAPTRTTNSASPRTATRRRASDRTDTGPSVCITWIRTTPLAPTPSSSRWTACKTQTFASRPFRWSRPFAAPPIWAAACSPASPSTTTRERSCPPRRADRSATRSCRPRNSSTTRPAATAGSASVSFPIRPTPPSPERTTRWPPSSATRRWPTENHSASRRTATASWHTSQRTNWRPTTRTWTGTWASRSFTPPAWSAASPASSRWSAGRRERKSPSFSTTRTWSGPGKRQRPLVPTRTSTCRTNRWRSRYSTCGTSSRPWKRTRPEGPKPVPRNRPRTVSCRAWRIPSRIVSAMWWTTTAAATATRACWTASCSFHRATPVPTRKASRLAGTARLDCGPCASR
mmetsp:Transcript_19957/g.41078  ORF Transcript_19957/g.41078 Transcript_19957/m.41078 type:complete len:345 (+) Transcript_19957:696-1730(+)